MSSQVYLCSAFYNQGCKQLYTIRYTRKNTVYQHLTFSIFNAFQRFLDSFRLAWKIEDQRLLADNANLTRKDSRRNEV